jgi:general secretion pathway protein D
VGRSAQRSGVPGTPGYTPPATTPGGINPLTGQPTQPAANAFGANAATQRSAFQQRLQGIIQRAATGGDFQILGQTKIISDARTNSLLIFANDQDMAMIKDIIGKLDVVLAQVLIEAIIMEVSLDNGRNLGVSMQQRPQQSGKLTTAGGENNGQNFLGSLTNLTSGANGLPAGFSYFGTYGNDFDFAVTAIATDNRVNVLSRPRVQTSHAVPAELFIGQTVPYITGTINDINGGARSQYTAQQIGIHLNVTPLINPDGLVVMDIVQQIQQLGTPQRIDNNDVPTTTDRNASAKVAVRDRDTIVLGGFISSSSTRSRSGVPWLKDIPIIGAAFRSESKNHQRVELIAMIRPTVLPTPESAALQANIEKERLPGVKAAELESIKDEAKRREKFESDLRKSQ